jgi:hypothetical protein
MRHRRSELLLGKFLLVVAFPLVRGHFTVHYMCCTRMTFRLGVRDSLITTEGHPRAGGLPAGPRLPAEGLAAVRHIDSAYGDRNLVCSCPPVKAFA